jgi:hypothetical protein
MAIIIFYVNYVYFRGSLEAREDGTIVGGNPVAAILLIGIIYPMCYSTIQAMKVGPLEYFTDTVNWIDILYVIGSLAMSILHFITSPFLFLSKAVMIFVIFVSILKTFKSMRIITLYSPIVTMLQTVVFDLKAFILFFMILVAMFSLTIGVLGNGNPNPDINPALAYAKA